MTDDVFDIHRLRIIAIKAAYMTTLDALKQAQSLSAFYSPAKEGEYLDVVPGVYKQYQANTSSRRIQAEQSLLAHIREHYPNEDQDIIKVIIGDAYNSVYAPAVKSFAYGLVMRPIFSAIDTRTTVSYINEWQHSQKYNKILSELAISTLFFLEPPGDMISSLLSFISTMNFPDQDRDIISAYRLSVTEMLCDVTPLSVLYTALNKHKVNFNQELEIVTERLTNDVSARQKAKAENAMPAPTVAELLKEIQELKERVSRLEQQAAP